MIAEIGLLCLVLGLLCAIAQVLPGFPQRRATLLHLALVAVAFFCLVWLRMQSDFTVTNVAEHSNLTLPLLYKITGTWGNHEGSMLRWTLVLAGAGALLLRFRVHDAALITQAVRVQGLLGAGILIFIIATSNPFARQFPPPRDGSTLNPLLQDIGLAIHPPLLYLGYVGFSTVFSLAVAALLTGRMTRSWARIAQPFILLAWSFLTLGIGLGSWWAYRELGWGGFWFWDPVENASLLPWFAGTALLHSNLVLERRGALTHWVLILAITTFAMSLLGTFLVRSGVITSVHSFASDPSRGMFIMAYILLFVGGSLALYAFRAQRITSEGILAPLSREGSILLNNILMLTACATVLLGTVYPMAAEWLSGVRISVGSPFFNLTVLPLIACALLIAALAPLVPWQNAKGYPLMKQAYIPAAVTGAVMVLVALLAKTNILPAAAGMGLAAWLAAGTARYAMRLRKSKSRSRHQYAVVLAHLGAAIMAAGVAGASLWHVSAEQRLQVGDTFNVGPYAFTYADEQNIRRPNHSALQGTLAVSEQSSDVATLKPELRVYAIRNATTSETAIAHRWWGDIYVVIGEKLSAGGVGAHVYLKPLIHWIWLGCVLMAFGGFLGIRRIMKE